MKTVDVVAKVFESFRVEKRFESVTLLLPGVCAVEFPALAVLFGHCRRQASTSLPSLFLRLFKLSSGGVLTMSGGSSDCRYFRPPKIF